jgi:hypothetical protein
MNEIKRRRLEELEVHCYPGTRVGQYVPFYFCPGSVICTSCTEETAPG